MGWLAEFRRLEKLLLGRGGEHDPEQDDFTLGDPGLAPYVTTGFLIKRVACQAAQAARAANYTFLLKRLKHLVPEPFAHLPEGASPFAFPIQSDRRRELFDQLARNAIQVGYLWPRPHSSLPAADFPRVVALKKSTVVLPVHQELGVGELERIVDSVLNSLGSIQRSTYYASRSSG